MTAFFILIIFITCAILFYQYDKGIREDKADKEYRRQYNAEYEQKKALEKETFDNHTSAVENIFSKNTNKPVVFEIKELPDDFEEVEYTAFDFETGNGNPLSAISLGIAHFRGNKLLEVVEFMFSPVNKESFEFTHIHGLQIEDVENLPSFQDQFNEISNHLNNRLLVAHNAEFDTDVLKSLLTVANKKLTKNKISCTYKLSKRFMKYENSYSLKNLCAAYKIPYWNHKAGYDAVSAGILFMHCLAASPGGSVTEGAMRGRAIALKPQKEIIQ